MRNTSNCTLRITKSTPKKPCCSSEKTDKEAALQTLRQRFPCVRPMPRRGGINARLAYDFFRFLKRPQDGKGVVTQGAIRCMQGHHGRFGVGEKLGTGGEVFCRATDGCEGRKKDRNDCGSGNKIHARVQLRNKVDFDDTSDAGLRKPSAQLHRHQMM